MAYYSNEFLTMKIERTISWFDKYNELLVSEMKIDFIELEILKTIFSPLADDPLMYYVYDIDEEKALTLKRYTNIEFDFDKYSYQLDCFQAE